MTLNDTFLTIEQTAARLQVGRNTVRQMIARGDLRTWRSGRTVRVVGVHGDGSDAGHASMRSESESAPSGSLTANQTALRGAEINAGANRLSA